MVVNLEHLWLRLFNFNEFTLDIINVNDFFIIENSQKKYQFSIHIYFF